MHHDHVDAAAAQREFAVQQAALLETVIRHVLVLVPCHLAARQQRIAVLAVLGGGIGDIHGLVMRVGQEVGLALARPVVELAFPLAVQLAHLLQADHIGVELTDGLLQVVDFEPTHRTHALHTLVDVVGGHAQHLLAWQVGRNRRRHDGAGSALARLGGDRVAQADVQLAQLLLVHRARCLR